MLISQTSSKRATLAFGGGTIHGDKVAGHKIDKQITIEHYHAYYGTGKAREHDLHKLYLRRLFTKPRAEMSQADIAQPTARQWPYPNFGDLCLAQDDGVDNAATGVPPANWASS